MITSSIIRTEIIILCKRKSADITHHVKIMCYNRVYIHATQHNTMTQHQAKRHRHTTTELVTQRRRPGSLAESIEARAFLTAQFELIALAKTI